MSNLLSWITSQFSGSGAPGVQGLALTEPSPRSSSADRCACAPSSAACACQNDSPGTSSQTEGAAPEQASNSLQRESSSVRGSAGPRVLFASASGSTRQLAEAFALQASNRGVQLRAEDLADYELENLCKETLVVCFISTQDGGQPPATAT